MSGHDTEYKRICLLKDLKKLLYDLSKFLYIKSAYEHVNKIWMYEHPEIFKNEIEELQNNNECNEDDYLFQDDLKSQETKRYFVDTTYLILTNIYDFDNLLAARSWIHALWIHEKHPERLRNIEE